MNWFNLWNFWISYDIWSWFRTNYLLKISWVGKSCAMFIKKCMIRCWTEVRELVLETLSNRCMWQWHLPFDLGFSGWLIVCFHLIDVWLIKSTLEASSFALPHLQPNWLEFASLVYAARDAELMWTFISARKKIVQKLKPTQTQYFLQII